MQLYYDDEIGHNTSIFSDFGVSPIVRELGGVSNDFIMS